MLGKLILLLAQGFDYFFKFPPHFRKHQRFIDVKNLVERDEGVAGDRIALRLLIRRRRNTLNLAREI